MIEELKTELLDNGLTVVGQVDPTAYSAAVGVFVRNGSRDELARESGISHFIEHMLFKGTKMRSALDLTYAISNIGAQANAFTSEESTVYYAAILPEHILEMEGILMEMLQPSFPEDELELERKVVLEEIAQYQDRPQFCLFEKACKDYFGEHPSGNSILGAEDSISSISKQAMQEYFSRRYVASNIIVTACGNFVWDAFLEQTRNLSADLSCSGSLRLKMPHSYHQLYREYHKEDLHQGHILLVAPGPCAHDDERFAFAALSTMIGDATGSRMYFDIVEAGLAETACMDCDEREDSGCVTLYAVTDLRFLDKVAEKMREHCCSCIEFTESEIERAKKKLCVRLVHANDVPMSRLIGLGGDYMSYGRAIPITEHLKRIQAISYNEIMAALERFPINELSEFRLI